MPKRGKVIIELTDNKAAISNRISSIRADHNLSQHEIALDILGFPANRYRSYKYLRAPIKYSVGAKICEEFRICQKWIKQRPTRTKTKFISRRDFEYYQ